MKKHRLLLQMGLSAGLALAPLHAAMSMISGSDSTPASSGSSSSTTPGDAAVLYAQARASVDAGDYAAAVGPLQQVVAAEPNNADAFNLLGYASRSLGQYTDASGYYEQALAIDPEHLGANEYYGELMLTLGNLAGAQERLAVLDEVCYLGCDELDALETAINEYMSAE